VPWFSQVTAIILLNMLGSHLTFEKGFSGKNFCKRVRYTVRKNVMLFQRGQLFFEESDVFETLKE
jgi:hypothetical protein